MQWRDMGRSVRPNPRNGKAKLPPLQLNYYTDGTVAKVAIGGGTLTTFATDQGDPEATAHSI